MVTVEVAVPSAVTPVEGEVEIVEFATTGAPATKVTEPVTAPKPAGVAMLTVLDCALVEARVPVAWPFASVCEAGWTSVLFVPFEAKVTVWPLTGLLFTSFRVIVTVEVADPSAVIELVPEIVELA